MASRDRVKLAVLYGGCSGEHEISLLSAASVLSALDQSIFDVTPIGIDKQGKWFVNPLQRLLDLNDKALEITVEGTVPLQWEDSKLQLLGGNIDVVFPVVHGPLYEDGCLQGLFELANIAYVGSGVLSSAVAMDKDVAKRLVKEAGVDTARHIVLKASMTSAQLEQQCQYAFTHLGQPLFVKPARMGSSVGAHRVDDFESIMVAVNDAFQYDDKLIVEEFITGHEIELAVLENSQQGLEPLVSVAGEICVSKQHPFYSYQAKYLDQQGATLLIPASVNDQVACEAKRVAQKIFNCLEGEGMSRVDLFVTHTDGRILFNEMNTIPGFTEISMYPKLWQASGITYTDLLTKLIDLAQVRHQNKQRLKTNYQ